jgi:hypothetical protein
MKVEFLWIGTAFATLLLPAQASTQELSPPPSPKGKLVQPLSKMGRLNYEDVGTIMVRDGTSCGSSNVDGRESPITIVDSMALPGYATEATVFLNGWDVEYLDKDHHIRNVGSKISDIRIEGGELRWEATGNLRDTNFDDGYRWCYYYTVVAWNRERINATVLTHQDNYARSVLAPDEEVALVKAPGSWQDRLLRRGANVAVVSRGFDVGWGGFSNEDHHLFQIAYNLGHAAMYLGDNVGIPPATPDRMLGSGAASWETHSIFKDNSAKRSFNFSSFVSVIAGSGVEMIDPPFTIIPKEDVSWPFTGCLRSPSGLRTQDYVVENVPFDYAIPVLKGWDLSYQCDDEHVKQAGIWLHDINYTRNSGSLVGALRYRVSSVLRNRHSTPSHHMRVKVSILGMNGPTPGQSIIMKKR